MKKPTFSNLWTSFFAKTITGMTATAHRFDSAKAWDWTVWWVPQILADSQRVANTEVRNVMKYMFFRNVRLPTWSSMSKGWIYVFWALITLVWKDWTDVEIFLFRLSLSVWLNWLKSRGSFWFGSSESSKGGYFSSYDGEERNGDLLGDFLLDFFKFLR